MKALAPSILVALVLAAAPAAADGPPRPPVVRRTLDNGLRVVLLADHTSPTVAVEIVYDVGGRNEQRGRTGFAHLFEHMMFQGSKNVPRGDHARLVVSHGGVLNGGTSEDFTSYYALLPSSELALGLWLEADRLKSLDVSAQSFENQRAVVKEEYRMRVENAPYVPASHRLRELVFAGYFPYEHSPIGSMRDLDTAQHAWVTAFHDTWYAPNNAALAIVGDFEEEEAMRLVRRYFDDVRPNRGLPKPTFASLPEPASPKQAMVVDDHAKLAALLFGWPIPASGDADHYALELAAMALGDGESSRLHRTLVRDRSLAIQADAGTDDHRGPDAFSITVKLARGVPTANALKATTELVGELAQKGPTDDEMQKLKNRARARFLLGLQSNFARAERLAEMELARGDANLVFGELDRYLAVTKDDIRRVVAKYLTPARRSLVEVKPTVETKP